ncbi:major facilitator superfamily domain-containing protein [Exophiala viscosa]|uniref:Citrate exporter 1 n=1 Tax=Exophiala viscosa TaxID=2486360 RepID=A0AAN6E0D6_9EURO|nr:major facilitator superfamily domain-containing protein [Exophiala viscosa]KAI1624199.1 major facilitator superfamily domain-containing protein [Exophiala viscosa]
MPNQDLVPQSSIATSEKRPSGELPTIQNDTSSPTAPESVAAAYCVYERKTKWALVAMVAISGFFSPFPANIYFPAMPTLAKTFNVSLASIDLTVTIYLVMQGVSPMLWGPLSDRYGRRPIFLICLAILVASCIGLALTPTNAYWLLLLLRAIQAGGCASTIALGAGVIGDISTPQERGGFFGMFNLGPMLAPCIAPVLGGALSEGLGWRSIFWFLTISAAACFAMIALLLPETLRNLVGNGSIAPPNVLHHAWWKVIRVGTLKPMTDSGMVAGRPSPNVLKLLVYPDVLLTLFYTGVVYAVNYTITATISSSFANIYPELSTTSIGLCYLATGGGMILGSSLTGKLLDLEYVRIKKRRNRCGAESDEARIGFPIEKARLRLMPILLIIFLGCVISWGWCLKKRISIAGPLVLQFILGYTSIAILNATMTLMIDILPAQSSGIIACTNLVRCSLAAVLVSVIDRSTNSIGYAWTYVILGGLCLFLLPLMYVEMSHGPQWRMRRDLNQSQ